MTELIDTKQLKFFAELKAVKFTKHTDFHVQLQGKYQVNVYPTTGRVYIQGMNYSARIFDHGEAVDYATGDRFPDGVEGKRRRCMSAKKRALWDKTSMRRCPLCGEVIKAIEEATVDHKIPLSRGGSHQFDNLQLAHEACNQKKGNAV